jgi:hypothetical protein
MSDGTKDAHFLLSLSCCPSIVNGEARVFLAFVIETYRVNGDESNQR